MDYPRNTEEHRMRATKRRYDGANVRFFDAEQDDPAATLKEGRRIVKFIPSIEIQWPGHDRTCRAIEPQDIQEYPELYAAYKAGNEIPQDGTPLEHMLMLPKSAATELKYMGCRTIEQLANATDDFKRRMGPLSSYVKDAKQWIGAAGSDQNRVVALEKQLEREQKKTKKLEEQVHLLMQRIEAVEGTRLNDPIDRRN